MAAEKRIQDKIINLLEEEEKSGKPLYHEKRQAGGWTYKIGLPDLYIVYNGIHYEVELKAEDGKRSSAQIKWEMIFKKKNISYTFVKSFEEFQKVYEKIKKGENINED